MSPNLSSVKDHETETGGSLKAAAKLCACTKQVITELVEPVKK